MYVNHRLKLEANVNEYIIKPFVLDQNRYHTFRMSMLKITKG